jgi:two-component system, cell cycle sensor histidine kinase and response regulator CckA
MPTIGGRGQVGQGDLGKGGPPDELERMAQRLNAAERRLRSVFDSPMIGLLFWEREGMVTEANDAFLKIVGYTREDLAQRRLDWLAITPEEYRAVDAAASAEIQRAGVCAPYEKEYLHKNGHRIRVLLGGASLGPGEDAGVAFVLDVSDKHQREHEHLAAIGRLRSVIDNAPLVLWAVDREGLFTLAEGRGLKAMGLLPGQLVGQSVFQFYAPFPDALANVRRALAGKEVTEIENAGERWFETAYSPIKDPAGAITGVLGVSIDVTDKQRADQEREQLQVQLLEVQKLESLGLLAGGIAHDFNNFLTAILGGASTALLSLPAEHPARRDIDNVVTAARRAADLTRQMLAYSGKGYFEIKPLDLSSHVRELATLLETTISKLVQLRLELADGLPAIEADVAQVQQVVMNLVINAAEAIGEQRGTVLVTTGAQDIDDSYAQALSSVEDIKLGRYVYLEVHDTGAGMDEATRARIFDPFFTTKFTGRGLGLAAVMGIVRAHRGAIKVYSSPGKGTTFKVFFPAAESAAVPIKVNTLNFKGHGLVLVIDDDASVRRVTRRMLEHFGFRVLEANDGRAGADTFAKHAPEIALVILDMTMPQMGGEETFRELRTSRQDVRVLLTSGYNEIEATRRFTAKGLAGFLQKPFTPTELAAKLAAVLR